MTIQIKGGWFAEAIHDLHAGVCIAGPFASQEKAELWAAKARGFDQTDTYEASYVEFEGKVFPLITEVSALSPSEQPPDLL